MKPILTLSACLAVLSGCANDAQTYPRLLPTAQVLAEPTLPDHAPDAAVSSAAVDAQAQSQADSLRRRADSLRGPVIEPEVLSRMSRE